MNHYKFRHAITGEVIIIEAATPDEANDFALAESPAFVYIPTI